MVGLQEASVAQIAHVDRIIFIQTPGCNLNMDSQDKIEKWKRLFDDGFSYYKDLDDDVKRKFEKGEIELMLWMLDDLTKQTTV